MGVSLLAGSAAKEIIISTMGVLYETDFEESGQQTLPEKLAGKGTQTAAMTPLAAFSFMIFILIYFPCIAVFAAIKKESGQWKWPLFTTFYTTFLAYLVSLIVFQAGSLLGF